MTKYNIFVVLYVSELNSPWHPSIHEAFRKYSFLQQNGNAPDTILSFFEVVPKGGKVIEIGGHIGYFTIIYSHLVGTAGRIWVFEPGSNNLPYIKKNIAESKNITLIEKAVSDTR